MPPRRGPNSHSWNKAYVDFNASRVFKPSYATQELSFPRESRSPFHWIHACAGMTERQVEPEFKNYLTSAPIFYLLDYLKAGHAGIKIKKIRTCTVMGFFRLKLGFWDGANCRYHYRNLSQTADIVNICIETCNMFNLDVRRCYANKGLCGCKFAYSLYLHKTEHLTRHCSEATPEKVSDAFLDISIKQIEIIYPFSFYKFFLFYFISIQIV